MMTDSPLATPTLALQCDHPPLAHAVVQRPPACSARPFAIYDLRSVVRTARAGAAPLLLHAARNLLRWGEPSCRRSNDLSRRLPAFALAARDPSAASLARPSGLRGVAMRPIVTYIPRGTEARSGAGRSLARASAP